MYFCISSEHLYFHYLIRLGVIITFVHAFAKVELGRELRVKSALRYKEQIEKGKKEKGEQRRLKKLKATQNVSMFKVTVNFKFHYLK